MLDESVTHVPELRLTPELAELRRRYADEALRAIPRILGLADRNPYSPTYGSFDRSYWHYRTMDFPCGMSQEFVLPLALAWRHPFPDNPYFQQPRLREIALAGIEFARRTSHANGSCDDYFPYEQALGALVFSLYAMTEATQVLGERRDEFIEFFARRGDWLLRHNESGKLANHQALAALALQNVYSLTGERRFAEGRDKYLDIVQSWQNPEGWFQEYEGADPGYHSCSIAFLGKLLKKTDDAAVRERLLKMLRPAVKFAWHFMHPDGSYAGEYGSRNTYHFYPHGFEVMAPLMPEAGQIADQFLNYGLPKGARYYNDDDRMCAHYVYDWMQSYLDFCPERPAPLNDRPNFTKHFPAARMLVHKTDKYYAVLSLAKGGVLKVTTDAGALYSDTGLIGSLQDGRVIVSHLVGDYETRVEEEQGKGGVVTASAAGAMHERKVKLPSPFKLIVFRCINLTFGRYASNLLRKMLQKVLITGKPKTAFGFTRKFRFEPGQIVIENDLTRPQGEAEFVALDISSDATSIYVANSNTYQRSVLLPWKDLGAVIPDLNTTGRGHYTHFVFDPAKIAERQG